MWKILLLLLFARESIGCECPGVSINGSDQSYCWQIVDRNASTWSSADDACAAVGGRMGHPEDIETLRVLATYLRPIFSLPVLTGYLLNTQTGDIAMMCRANEFHAVANDTPILGKPSEAEQCVIITNDDFMMHFGPCATAAMVLCSQPENFSDYCSVAPTCRSSTTLDYNTPTSFRTTNTIDVDNSTKSSTASHLAGIFSTSSTQSTTTGNDTICGEDEVGVLGSCVPSWFFALTIISIAMSALLAIGCFLHHFFRCCWWHSHPAEAADVESGSSVVEDAMVEQGDQQGESSRPLELEMVFHPPIEYSVVDESETEDKAMMTDPWELPEPVIIYRERAPEPKDEYESEESVILPPAVMMARSEEPLFMESEDDEPHRFVAAPVIVRPHHSPPPPLPSPRGPFPLLPRRSLTDEDLPQSVEKKRNRRQLQPFVFLYNAPPKKRPLREEPEYIPTPSRGPRAFPPPPPVSRSLPIQDRPFPEQFKPPAEPGPKQSRPLPPPPRPDPPRREKSRESPAPMTSSQKRSLIRAEASRPVINKEPEPSWSKRRSAQPHPEPSEALHQLSAPTKPSSPKPVPRGLSSGGDRPAAAAPARSRSWSPSRRAAPTPRANSPFAAKQRSVAEPQGRLFKPNPPRLSRGSDRPAASAPVILRTRSWSPSRRAALAMSAFSPFAAKQNSDARAPQGSLFKAAPPRPIKAAPPSLFKPAALSQAAAKLRAARGKLGGVVGGHGEVPRGWKAWSPHPKTFSTIPGSDF